MPKPRKPRKNTRRSSSSLSGSWDSDFELQMDLPRTTNKRNTRTTRKPTSQKAKNLNSSIVVVDDSDEECLSTIISRYKVINESVTNKVDDFFKSSGLLSDDEDEPILPSFLAKNNEKDHESRNVDTNAPSSSKTDETKTTNSDSVVVIDDEPIEITTREDIENYCRETEDILKSAKAILDKFTGAKTEEETSSTESNVTKNNGNEQPRGLGECPVCYENLSEKQVMTTKCGHLFCKVCIERIAISIKKCPTCRKAVNKKNIIPIYI
ncbi:E3 ubiquitin-protein ligase BRE1-like [Harmonia axyridis]|uniref:E3 ubiquitin-protein ligase BRE1-like n=1 Tax=Harmonia axyridis TaxID=115357 RepID=UPI001E2789B4|nr:E3 ubiquitin-protein ligase BRE1-like [Harmonia axyridis]